MKSDKIPTGLQLVTQGWVSRLWLQGHSQFLSPGGAQICSSLTCKRNLGDERPTKGLGPEGSGSNLGSETYKLCKLR